MKRGITRTGIAEIQGEIAGQTLYEIELDRGSMKNII